MGKQRELVQEIKQAKKRSKLKRYCIEHEQCRECKYKRDGVCIFKPSPYSWEDEDILIKQEEIPSLTSF